MIGMLLLGLLLPKVALAQALQSPCDSQVCASNLQSTQTAQPQSSSSSPRQTTQNPMDLNSQAGINLNSEFAPANTTAVQLTGWIALGAMLVSLAVLIGVIDWYYGSRLLGRIRRRPARKHSPDQTGEVTGKDTHSVV